jgi:hypothetical protein
MGDAGRKLTERRHLLRVDQIGLGSPQFPKRLLGRVARPSDLLLRSLALCDIAIYQHEPAAGYKTPPHLYHSAVRAGALNAQLLISSFEPTAEFCLDVLGTKFAAFGEHAEVLRIHGPFRENGVGEVYNLLKVSIPGGEVQPGIEHRNPIAHIVEGDAQFSLALTDLIEQTGILYCDNRLRCEMLQHCDLLIGIGPHGPTPGRDCAEQTIVLTQGYC